MNNNQANKLCYVFSPSTVEIAISEWLDLMIETDAKKSESFKIVEAALPWFLDHIQQDASIYMFTHDDLLVARQTWTDKQIAAYPKQKKRIKETSDLLMDFFKSEVVIEHKMLIKA